MIRRTTRRDVSLVLGLAALVVLSLLAGCRTQNVAAMKTYELITDYDRMTSTYEPDISLVYVAPDAQLGGYDTLVVNRLDVSRVWVEKSERTDVYRPYVTDQITRALLSEKAFKKVVQDPQYMSVPRPDEKIVVLDAVITRMEVGNGTARYFLQLGATDFQIEGRFRDPQTGKTLLEFVERRREIDQNPSNPTAKTLDADYALKRTIREFAGSLSKLVRNVSEPARAGSKVATEAPAEKAQDGTRS